MSHLFLSVPRQLWSLTLVWFCLAVNPAMAQPDDGAGSPDGAQDAQQQTPEPQEDVSVTDQPGGIEAANASVEEQEGDADDEEEGTGAGRFIPSEQISQDIGVSFPADI